MSATKKQAPRKLITALRLEKELKEAKLALRSRDLHMKAAQEHAACIQEVLVTAKVLAQRVEKEYWPAEPKKESTALTELLDLLEEWSPAP